VRTVSLSSPPNSGDLTILGRLKEELGITKTEDDVLLARMISSASQMTYRIIGRPLYRAQWTETFAGNGRTETVLSRFPLMSIDAVTYGGTAESDAGFLISGRSSGSVYHSTGFVTSGDPTEWSITYTAGYFLPGDNLSEATLSATAADKSFNDSASGFPLLVRDGDEIEVSGFTGNTSNNGVKTIDGITHTAAKIIVDQVLVNDASGELVTIVFEHADVAHFERVITDLIGSSYADRKRDKGLASITVGDVALHWNKDAQRAARSALTQFSDFV